MKSTNAFTTCAKAEGLTVFEVNGVSAFPLYGATAVTSKAVAFVAKDAMDFPEMSPFDANDGLSADKKYYRVSFDARREYRLEEFQEIASAAKKALA